LLLPKKRRSAVLPSPAHPRAHPRTLKLAPVHLRWRAQARPARRRERARAGARGARAGVPARVLPAWLCSAGRAPPTFFFLFPVLLVCLLFVWSRPPTSPSPPPPACAHDHAHLRAHARTRGARARELVRERARVTACSEVWLVRATFVLNSTAAFVCALIIHFVGFFLVVFFFLQKKKKIQKEKENDTRKFSFVSR
jgi:hypothetical protein